MTCITFAIEESKKEKKDLLSSPHREISQNGRQKMFWGNYPLFIFLI